MPQRTIKLLTALAGVLWTSSGALLILAIMHDRNGLGALAALTGEAALVPSVYLLVANIVDRHRTIMLSALLDALERTEQDVVRSITRH